MGCLWLTSNLFGPCSISKNLEFIADILNSRVFAPQIWIWATLKLKHLNAMQQQELGPSHVHGCPLQIGPALANTTCLGYLWYSLALQGILVVHLPLLLIRRHREDLDSGTGKAK